MDSGKGSFFGISVSLASSVSKINLKKKCIYKP